MSSQLCPNCGGSTSLEILDKGTLPGRKVCRIECNGENNSKLENICGMFGEIILKEEFI